MTTGDARETTTIDDDVMIASVVTTGGVVHHHHHHHRRYNTSRLRLESILEQQLQRAGTIVAVRHSIHVLTTRLRIDRQRRGCRTVVLPIELMHDRQIPGSVSRKHQTTTAQHQGPDQADLPWKRFSILERRNGVVTEPYVVRLSSVYNTWTSCKLILAARHRSA